MTDHLLTTLGLQVWTFTAVSHPGLLPADYLSSDGSSDEGVFTPAHRVFAPSATLGRGGSLILRRLPSKSIDVLRGPGSGPAPPPPPPPAPAPALSVISAATAGSSVSLATASAPVNTYVEVSPLDYVPGE